MFVNTLDVLPQQEELKTPDDLRRWLVDRGLLERGAKVTPQDFRRALEVREALRHLLAANVNGGADAGALRALNGAAERAELIVRFDRNGRAELNPCARGVDAAIGRILSAAYAAMINGTWQRLKACSDDRCVWAFYDQSKNRSSRWCSMAVCGNRHKARKHRQTKTAP